MTTKFKTHLCHAVLSLVDWRSSSSFLLLGFSVLKILQKAMETALEVARIILEYFGWDGDEIEVCLLDDSIVRVTLTIKLRIYLI